MHSFKHNTHALTLTLTHVHTHNSHTHTRLLSPTHRFFHPYDLGRVEKITLYISTCNTICGSNPILRKSFCYIIFWPTLFQLFNCGLVYNQLDFKVVIKKFQLSNFGLFFVLYLSSEMMIKSVTNLKPFTTDAYLRPRHPQALETDKE